MEQNCPKSDAIKPLLTPLTEAGISLFTDRLLENYQLLTIIEIPVSQMQHDLFTNENNNLLPFDGEVNYIPRFFTSEQSTRYFEQLKTVIRWKQEPVILFGKQIMQPRLTAYCGDPEHPYGYSGIMMEIQPWYPFLQEIKNAVENITQHLFNGVLLNFYRDGQDSMGWHRDNEKELGLNPVIASVSFGGERKFQFRHYREKDKKVSILLNNGSLLVMKGSTNHHWEHQLPKSKQVIRERINLTFRSVTKKF